MNYLSRFPMNFIVIPKKFLVDPWGNLRNSDEFSGVIRNFLGNRRKSKEIVMNSKEML